MGAEPANPYGVVAALCHDIRTPLGSLHAAVDVLRDHEGMPAEEIAAMVERLRRGLVWLEGLVDDLSTWAERRDGALDLHVAPVRVADVVGCALDVVGPLLAQRRQTVTTQAVDSDMWVMGDSVKLTQVLVNLLANASAYSPVRCPIEVTVGRRDESAEVRVTDRGPGLSTDEQDNIFERYVRGAAGQAHEGRRRGSGLGLSIVREIVELHGGVVGVESTPGRGASFWFHLPAPLNAVEHAGNAKRRVA
jgi:signal transduction histidine kinase